MNFLGGPDNKESACNAEDLAFRPWVRKIPWRIWLHSSTLAWRIPWTEEPGGLCPWGRRELDRTELLTLSFTENQFTICPLQPDNHGAR